VELSGVGPVEPGEGTRAEDDLPGLGAPSPPGRLAPLFARHRRAALVTGAALAVLVGGLLHATRPRPAPPPPPPFPSQAVDFTYLGTEPPSADLPARSFRFGVEVTTRDGPAVTVTRVSQPYAGLTVSTTPRPPFRSPVGDARTIVITMRVTDCGKVPRNVGLPFLDVTLRNRRAIEDHSFILGRRYARDLSEAIQVACSNDTMSLPKTKNTPENADALPAASHYVDWANRP
jgi:hypothetical protein